MQTYFYNRPGGKFVECNRKTALAVMKAAGAMEAFFVIPVLVFESGTEISISDLEPRIPGAGVAAVRFNRALLCSGPEGVREALEAYYEAAHSVIAASLEE